MSKLSISRIAERSFKTKLANAVLPVGRVRVDTRKADMVLKVVNAVTRDAMTASNSAVHRAVSDDRPVAMMLKAMLNKLRAVTQAEVRPVTVKARRADERDTDKVRRRIDADTLRIKAEFNREEIRSNADIRHGHPTVVKVEPKAISVRPVVIKIRTTSRHVVIKTINKQERLSPNPPTMTSAVDVGASSRKTRRSRHSISVPHVRPARLEHVRLVRPVAIARNVAAMFPTMRLRSRDQRVGTRLNAVPLADRAVMGKRAIVNCQLAVEANDRLRRPVR